MQMTCKYNANDMQLLMQMSILPLESTAEYSLICLLGSKSEGQDASCFGGEACVLWRRIWQEGASQGGVRAA